ncbi:MAG: tetratricopeptide repeat protein [Bacteroidetes bacterium]|nr:tetratricopeptide repeat protein [Bacteroidota bacterium]
MKQFLLLFTLMAAICSCSNNQEQPVIKTDKIPEQEKEMRDAIAKYPDSAVLKATLIQYFEDNGSYEMAIAELDKWLKKDSTQPQLWDKMGELYMGTDDTVKAIPYYKKAIGIYPDPKYIMTLGWIYATRKDSNALVMADALLFGKKAAAEREALLIKGIYYSAVGQQQKALGFFDQCLAIDYTYTNAYREKGITLYEMGRYADALQVLNRGVTVQNNFAEGYYWMARCLEKLNRLDEAIDNYKTALLYDHDYDEAKDALGRLGVK